MGPHQNGLCIPGHTDRLPKVAIQVDGVGVDDLGGVPKIITAVGEYLDIARIGHGAVSLLGTDYQGIAIIGQIQRTAKIGVFGR